MKKSAAGVAFLFLATSAFAGGYDEPEVAPPVIMQDAAESSAPSPEMVIFLLTTITFGAALSN